MNRPNIEARTKNSPEIQTGAAVDLTARARIRDAALNLFAMEGFERATIREIARAAGVSAGLVRHHYGSKDELRRACDDYVIAALRSVNAQLFEDPSRSYSARRQTEHLQQYVVRALVDGSTTVASLFDEMVVMAEQWIERADVARSAPATVDPHVRAVLVTAMKAGIPLLHEHISRVLGLDIFEPEGERAMALALLDIYSHPLINEETVSAAKTGYDPPSPDLH